MTEDLNARHAEAMRALKAERDAMMETKTLEKGLLLVHISNRFLDLAPVVAAAAGEGGWHAAMLEYHPDDREGAQAAISDWIALTRDRDTLGKLVAQGGGWEPLGQRKGFTAWTDDYATILPLLRSLQ